jgi:feruloyl-CoA synthase
VFPTPALRALSGLPDTAPLSEVATAPPVLAHFQGVLNTLAQSATGSANRIARLCVLADPPSLDKGEVTDKGSINQRAVLKHRDAIVQALHNGTQPGLVLPQT